MTTLAVLFILKTKFEDEEGEWVMIAKKGKQFLKDAGIANPDSVIRSLKLEIK